MRNDLHVTGIRLTILSYLEKRLLISTGFVLIDVKAERSTWSSICVSGVYYKTEESGME